MADADKDPQDAQSEPLFAALLAESPQLWNVADEFVRTLPGRIEPMEEALRDQAFDRLQSLARDLKDAGRTHKCDAIAHRAAAIEQAAHDHVLEDLTGRIAELTSLIAKIRAQLKGADG